MSEAPSGKAVAIRPLTELPQFQRCVELEEAVWGYDPADMVPRRLFLLASRIGGQVLGAFAGETMVGFAYALPAYRDGHAYLHSHMLAVLPGHRDAGIGRALKLAQRDDALARGFDLMEWTFDPLEIKNAHLNIARLGAVVRRYARDFYGPTTSLLQGGLPTDRVYAEWWLKSSHVERTLAGQPQPSEVSMKVQVPAEVSAWKATPSLHARARELQSRTADALEAAFAKELAIVGHERDANGDGTFLLAPWQEVHGRGASR